jgi:[CysO sulfur-carrier protein]-S-L-cysteine hydrolase
VGARDGRVTDVVALRNVHASPYRFEADGMELFRAMERLEEEGKELVAIYHSHPRTEAYPSQTDQALSAGYPGLDWIIVGHVQSGPVVRTFVVTPDAVEEVELEVA